MERSHPDGYTNKDTDLNTDSTMSKKKIIKNLLVVCFCFLFLFSAYQALANLQSTMNMENDLGVVSQAVIYFTGMVSSLFLPKLVIRRLGCKLTLVFSVITFVPLIAANFHPRMKTMIPAAVIIGIGGPPLWSAKCTYINKISVMFSYYDSDSADVATSKFFGIFFTFLQNTQIWGNLISFMILKPSGDRITNETRKITSELHPIQYVSGENNGSDVICGIEFCSGINENLLPPSEDKRYMLIGVYLGCAIFASVLTAVFLDPLPQRQEEEAEAESVFSTVIATMKHLQKTKQILLVPLTIFSGIQQAFFLGEYTQAYVACSLGLFNVGLVFICFGVVNAVMSFIVGHIVKYIPRKILMIVAASGNVAVCLTLHLWYPTKDHSTVFFVLAGIWGLSDAIWKTQINAFYGILFRSQEEAAFANYQLWESFGFAISFGYSTFLCVAAKIYIMLTFLGVGMLGYAVVEIKRSKEKRTYNVDGS